MFQKGQSGNPAGRPKGCLNKDTTNYLDFQLWFKQVKEDLVHIKEPEKRIHIALQVIDKMMTKIQSLPNTPGDSLDNARRAQDLLNALENDPQEPSGETDVVNPNV